MNLEGYQQEFEALIQDARLTPAEKYQALALLDQEIATCLWQPWARAEAAAQRRAIAAVQALYPDEGLDALNSLAAKGRLRGRP